MLLAITIELECERAAALPLHMGERARGAFFELVAAQDAALAAEIHADRYIQPYTVAWLGPRRAVAAGARAILRLTSLTAPLSRFFVEQLLPSLGPALEISGVRWRVVRLERDGEAATDPHGGTAAPGTATGPSAGFAAAAPGAAWAGATSYQQLARAWLLELRRPPPYLDLVFASPTAFRSGGLLVPLPLPRLLFGSLWERWNALAPVRLGDEVLAFAESEVAISRHRLQTEAVPLSGGLQVGFTGQCTYVVPASRPAREGSDFAWRALHLLAAFAFYAGAGIKTTMGMGVARPLRPPARPPAGNGPGHPLKKDAPVAPAQSA
jgi:CRISPR-associated endoribonuclease Cas6